MNEDQLYSDKEKSSAINFWDVEKLKEKHRQERLIFNGIFFGIILLLSLFLFSIVIVALLTFPQASQTQKETWLNSLISGAFGVLVGWVLPKIWGSKDKS